MSQTVRDRVSAEEWARRVELAALYRLTALYGWEAATAQVRALSAGRDGVLIAPAAAQEEVRRQTAPRSHSGDPARSKYEELAWGAIRRKVDRDSPGYAQ